MSSSKGGNLRFEYQKWFSIICKLSSGWTLFELLSNEKTVLSIDTPFPYRETLLKILWSDNSLLRALQEIYPLYWKKIWKRNLLEKFCNHIWSQDEFILNKEIEEILKWIGGENNPNEQIWFDVFNSLFFRTREWYYSVKEDRQKLLKLHLDNDTPFLLAWIYFRYPKKFQNKNTPLFESFAALKLKKNEDNVIFQQTYKIVVQEFFDQLMHWNWFNELLERLKITHIIIIPNWKSRSISFNNELKILLLDYINTNNINIKVLMPENDGTEKPQKTIYDISWRISNIKWTLRFTERHLGRISTDPSNVLIIDDTVQTCTTANHVARQFAKLNDNLQTNYYALWLFWDIGFDFT